MSRTQRGKKIHKLVPLCIFEKSQMDQLGTQSTISAVVNLSGVEKALQQSRKQAGDCWYLQN